MSAEARPISPSSFAQAIEDLPVENLYSKAFEINNSIAHLRNSNRSLQEYSDSIKNDESLEPEIRADGDKDCLQAIRENELVINRQQERVQLIKTEVERRGQRWHEADPKQEEGAVNGDADRRLINGGGPALTTTNSQARPRLTDNDIRRELETRLEQADDEEEGMYL